LQVYEITCFLCDIAPEDVEVWLDATVYEIFINPTTSLNEVIAKFNLTLRKNDIDSSGSQMNSSDSHNVNAILFHLQSSNNFYLANQNSSTSSFQDDHEHYVVELLSANDGLLPLNDYRMKLEVTVGNMSLTSSDVIIHVVDPLPTLPVPGNVFIMCNALCNKINNDILFCVVSCIGFSQSTYHIRESDGLLNITLLLNGNPKSFPVNVMLKANVSDLLFSSTGK